MNACTYYLEITSVTLTEARETSTKITVTTLHILFSKKSKQDCMFWLGWYIPQTWGKRKSINVVENTAGKKPLRVLDKDNVNLSTSIDTILPIWVFFREHSRITGMLGKGEGISLTPHYHFNPLQKHLYISRAITAESSPLHIASSRTRTGNLWFPSTSC